MEWHRPKVLILRWPTAVERLTESLFSFHSLFYEPPEFYTPVAELAESKKGGVGVALGWKVKKIDVVNRTAILEDGHEIKYQKCLLATG